MSTSIGLQELPEVRDLPLSKPHDEVVWQSRVENGRGQDRRGSAFSVSGDWQRTVVVTSAAPFVASLAWRNVRTVHDA